MAYTKDDRVISAKLELNDYLKEMEPDILCNGETKLYKYIELLVVGNRKYKVWSNLKRERRGI